jgi:hypothetical protein
MATLYKTDFATGKKTLPNAQGREVLSAKMDFAVSTAMVNYLGAVAAALTTNDVIEFGRLPAGHVLTNIELVSDDIDSNGSPAALMSAGILNSGKTGLSTDANGDGGNISGTLISGSNVGQTGGNARPAATNTSMWRLKPLETDRSVGVLIGTVPATQQSGTISLVISYRASLYGL